MDDTPLITHPAAVLGLLLVLLGLVFHTTQSRHPFWQRFYRAVPALLLCYLLPALINTLGIVDGTGTPLYRIAIDYLLPPTLALLTLSVDLPGIRKLGGKAIAMFLAGTFGVVIGGPIALLVFRLISPETVAGDTWAGMATLAGSWIGGGANQAAMKEVFDVSADLFGAFVAVDIVVANLWMAVLLWMAANHRRLDARRGADTTAIEALQNSMAAFQAANARIPTLADLIRILAIGFGAAGLATLLALPLSAAFAGQEWAIRLSLTSTFFWIVVITTTLGIGLSFTPVRRLEGAGASRIGSALLYVLIATIGLHMDLTSIVRQPALFAVGVVWMAVHATVLLIAARLLKAPTFFLAVGSQANIGAAASAPVVASAFHPALAPVGVLLAVLGYGLGTYAAWICAQLMRVAAG